MSQTPHVSGNRIAKVAGTSVVLTVVDVAMGTLMIVLFVLTRSWHQIAVAILAYLRAFLTFYAGRMARRGQVDYSVRLMLATLMGLLPAMGLFWTGAALPFAGAVFAVSATVAIILMPSRRRRVGLGLALLAALAAWSMQSLSLPWMRFDVQALPITKIAPRLITAAVVTLILGLFVQIYRQTTTLRLRLAMSFIGVVVVVAVAISASSIALGVQGTQERAFNQLETTVRLQEQAINAWIDQLQFALDSLIVEGYELQRAQALLLNTSTDQFRLDARGQLRNRFGRVIERTGWFTEIYLVTPEGEVVLSTDWDQEGRNVAHTAYFQQGLRGPYLRPPRYDPLSGGVSIIFAQPVIGQFDQVYGVLAARTTMRQLRDIAASGEAGSASEIYLIGQDYLLLTEPTLEGGYLPVHSPAIDTAVSERVTLATDAYDNHRNVPVLGVYSWLPRLSVAMVAELDQADVLVGARRTSFFNAGVAAIAALLAGSAALYLADDIGSALANLASTATRVAEGNLDLETDVERDDEIGAVARAFNAMTAQLRNLIDGLEIRVQERTQGLQAVAEVSRTTTSVLDPEELMPQIVDLVRERFDLYYVGLFLLDEAGGDAVLQAGTGEAGRQMLSEGWRLAVGGASMVGQCVASGEPIIRQQAGDEDEVVRFDNPLLPDTRSELALPLRYGRRVIGAMTVQSVEQAAFDETDIAVLQNMADQVAVAVQNAGLFAETQAALERAREMQRRYQTQAWSEYLEPRTIRGYQYDGVVVTSLNEDARLELDEDAWLRIPIHQGDQVVGVIGIERETDWSGDDVTFVESLVEQLALAAENQRLFDDVNRRAALEQAIGEVTSRVRAEVEIEAIVERTLSELGRALDADRGVALLSLDGEEERDA